MKVIDWDIPLIPLDDNSFADFASPAKAKLSGKYQKDNRDGNAGIKLNGKTVIDFKDAGKEAEFDSPFTLASWVKPDGNASGSVVSKMNTSLNSRGYELARRSRIVEDVSIG